MTLAGSITSDAARFLSADEFAHAATYVTVARASTAFTGVFELSGAVAEQDADGRRVVRLGLVHLSKSTVSSWAESAYVVLDTVRWEVVAATEEDDAMMTLQIKNATVVDKSGPEHRGRT